MFSEDRVADEPAAEPLIIDPSLLKPDTLEHLAKEFILREATQDGGHNVDLDAEIPKVVARIRRGDCLVTFDPVTESVGVRLKSE